MSDQLGIPKKQSVWIKFKEFFSSSESNVSAEGYDFHRLTSHLTRSLTNSLYRDYNDTAKKLYETGRGLDGDSSNDLQVAKLVEAIKAKAEMELTDMVSKKIAERIVFELDAQH
jgi:hypothetical protein